VEDRVSSSGKLLRVKRGIVLGSMNLGLGIEPKKGDALSKLLGD